MEPIYLKPICLSRADAQQLLDGMQEHNRKLRPDQVAKYRRAFLRGEFYPAVQPLRTDEDGRLVDGQHRLEGFLSAGLDSAWFYVHEQFPNALVPYLDNGASRSMGDALTLAFPEIRDAQTVAAAAAKLVFQAEKGAAHVGLAGGGPPNKAPTNAELQQVVRLHPQILRNADKARLRQATVGKVALAVSALRPRLRFEKAADEVAKRWQPGKATRVLFSEYMKGD